MNMPRIIDSRVAPCVVYAPSITHQVKATAYLIPASLGSLACSTFSNLYFYTITSHNTLLNDMLLFKKLLCDFLECAL
jgi:hypothetical protein